MSKPEFILLNLWYFLHFLFSKFKCLIITPSLLYFMSKLVLVTDCLYSLITSVFCFVLLQLYVCYPTVFCCFATTVCVLPNSHMCSYNCMCVTQQATAQMEEKLKSFIDNNATLDLVQESDAVLCFLHYQVLTAENNVCLLYRSCKVWWCSRILQDIMLTVLK